MFRLDNEAIIEAKDPLSSRKYERAQWTETRNDVTVMETRQDAGRAWFAFCSSYFHYCGTAEFTFLPFVGAFDITRDSQWLIKDVSDF